MDNNYFANKKKFMKFKKKKIRKKGATIPNFDKEVQKVMELKGIAKATAEYYVYILYSDSPRNKRIVQIMEEYNVNISKARRMEREEYENKLKGKIDNGEFQTQLKLDLLFQNPYNKRDK